VTKAGQGLWQIAKGRVNAWRGRWPSAQGNEFRLTGRQIL